MADDADVRFTGGAEFRALARDLRAAGDTGKRLRKRLRAAIVAEIRPMQRDTKRAALAIPTKGTGSTGLRKSIAKAIKVRVYFTPRVAGARLEVDPAKMPPGKYNLPAYMEGEKPRWRHPVFGRRLSPWADQEAHPYFYRTVDPRLPGAVVAIKEAAAITAAEIERGH